MIVRMLKPRFADLVAAGNKWQPVRPRPKRMLKEGDELSLRRWSALPYRSPQIEVRRTVVERVREVLLDAKIGVLLYTPEGAGYVVDADEFARDDGFANWREMRAWFEAEHGALPFRGIVIFWPKP